MGYLSREELEQMRFKKLGKHVMVSSLSRIYNPELTELGDYVRIDDFCVLMGKITLKKYVHIAMYCHLGGTREGIVMDEHSECAYRCAVITHSSDYSLSSLHVPCVPDSFKTGRSGPVYIGKYCLIGYDCLVMPNVRIEEGCSFGAFSYIAKDTRAWGLYSGKPAERIRDNSKECLLHLHEIDVMLNQEENSEIGKDNYDQK